MKRTTRAILFSIVLILVILFQGTVMPAWADEEVVPECKESPDGQHHWADTGDGFDPAPTCTAEGARWVTCEYCHERTAEPVAALGHDWVIIEGTAATCTKSGTTDGKYCTRCPEVVTQEEIPALGHEEQTIPAVEATCTEPGKTEGVCCGRCGETLTAQEEISALGHDETIDGAVASTLSTEGRTGTVSCTRCGETLEESRTIPIFVHVQ